MERVVIINPNVHRDIEAWTEHPFEVGGTLKFNDDDTQFIMDHKTSGEFSHVQIPKGLVQFHTHTSQCRDAICTMGFPSVQDLVEFTRAFMRGDALIHCLYSADGTYCISITPEMKRYLSKKSTLDVWKARTVHNLTSFYATLQTSQMNHDIYNDFRDNWVALAQSQGISIHRYDRGEIPKFCLVFTP